MALLRPIRPLCNTCPCQATVEVRTRYGVWIGQFCDACGQRAWREQERVEGQYVAPRPPIGYAPGHPVYPERRP